MSGAYLWAAVGGALIGLAASAYLVLNGRVMGISGLISGLFRPRDSDFKNRAAVLLGLVAGGGVLALVFPESLENTTSRSLGLVSAAGLLVGFGTAMGSGCTSGHGVCGISRLSMRSIVATLVFMATGFATVFALGR